MATPPPFIPGIGRLTTGRFAFQDHLEGTTPPESSTSFRHTADQIDMNPPVIGGATTVQSSLANVASFITAAASAGQGFITVGTGYDTYVNANGTLNYDPSIPSLDTVLNPILADILAYQNAYTPVPAAYERIRDGGIIVIPAGTYTVKNTIQVPPGITILGEGFGTKIVNGTGLNLAQQSPSLSGTPSPVFKILPDPNRITDDAAVDTNVFIFMRETRICNLVICDNFVEPTMLGDTNYRLAQNTSATTPLIQQENGSNLFLDQIYAAGRTSGGYTSSLVLLDTSTPAPSGTILKIDNCFIDGFSVPVQWRSIGNTGTPVNSDFLSITNSKIRGYGYLNGDGSDGYANSIVVMNDNNANIVDNYIYGNANNITAFVYMLNHLPTAPKFGARSKVIVHDNNVEINRSSNTLNTTFKMLDKNDTNFAGHFPDYCSAIAANNNFQNTFDIEIDGDSYAALTSNSNTVPSTLSIGFSTIASNSVTLEPTADSASVEIKPTPTTGSASVTIQPQNNGSNTGTVIIQGDHSVAINSFGSPPTDGTISINAINVVELISLNAGSGEVAVVADNIGTDSTNALFAAANGICLQPYSLAAFTPATGAAVVYPIQGTPNTQQMVGGRYLAVCNTLASYPFGTTFFTLPMVNNTAAFVEIAYTSKTTPTTTGSNSNRGAYYLICGNTGSITATPGTHPTLLYPNPFDQVSRITAIPAVNTISFQVSSLSVTYDWQFVIDIVYA